MVASTHRRSDADWVPRGISNWKRSNPNPKYYGMALVWEMCISCCQGLLDCHSSPLPSQRPRSVLAVLWQSSRHFLSRPSGMWRRTRAFSVLCYNRLFMSHVYVLTFSIRRDYAHNGLGCGLLGTPPCEFTDVDSDLLPTYMRAFL